MSQSPSLIVLTIDFPLGYECSSPAEMRQSQDPLLRFPIREHALILIPHSLSFTFLSVPHLSLNPKLYLNFPLPFFLCVSFRFIYFIHPDLLDSLEPAVITHWRIHKLEISDSPTDFHVSHPVAFCRILSILLVLIPGVKEKHSSLLRVVLVLALTVCVYPIAISQSRER
jgi:hypothetical protein